MFDKIINYAQALSWPFQACKINAYGRDVSDVLFSLYARRHLGKSQGRKMKVRGIAYIHPRQLFMNIKEQL